MFLDTVYTERYMGLANSNDNYKGYDVSTVCVTISMISLYYLKNDFFYFRCKLINGVGQELTIQMALQHKSSLFPIHGNVDLEL